MLTVKLRRAGKAAWTAELKSQILNLRSIAENCARQLRGWADSLQNRIFAGLRQPLNISEA
jgi:hypothetical protein